MRTFVDTSALVALLDGDDDNHADAAARWLSLADQSADLVTTNYVLVETVALVQHRMGVEAVRTLLRDIVSLLDIVYVDESIHGTAVSTLLAAGLRHLSLVDCVSFDVMRRADIATAFAYDRHFSDRGYPAP